MMKFFLCEFRRKLNPKLTLGAMGVTVALLGSGSFEASSAARKASTPTKATTVKAAKSRTISATSEIDMTFTDSSTPPQYHRSWKASVRKGRFTITVDAYGIPIAEDTFSVTPALWPKANAALARLVKAKSATIAGGCTGGTSRTLRVVVAGKTIVDADEALCGGANPKAEAIDEFAHVFLALVGDFDTFAKRGQLPNGSA
jgi:hypothetical protein